MPRASRGQREKRENMGRHKEPKPQQQNSVQVSEAERTRELPEEAVEAVIEPPEIILSEADGKTEASIGAEGLVVVTGVFDLLHIGHLRFLEAACRLGDRLIVGVESAERVRRWKGPHRPIQADGDRMALLMALRVVDGVFLITGERIDPSYYAEVLRPMNARYLAVTADDPFLKEKREAMAAMGVELRVVIPRIENYSTTRLVRLLGLP